MRRPVRALAALVPLLSLVAPACRPAGAGPAETPAVNLSEVWKAVDRSIDVFGDILNGRHQPSLVGKPA